jgi:Ca2+-transporting ATPase
VTDDPKPPAWHTLPPRAVLDQLEVSDEDGLDDDEVRRRRATYGENRIPEAPPPNPWVRLAKQFVDPLVGALLVAAVVSAVVAATGSSEGSWADTIAILLIVSLNAALGFVQEQRAEAALAALHRMAAPHAKVLRGGQVHDVEAAALVPGDVVVLAAGDAIPADARLIRAADLEVEESTLTGESVPVSKRADAVLPPETVVADRTSLVFTGTTATRGEARAVVVGTGSTTELGRIGALIGAARRAPTPLEQRLARLGRQILVACLVISALVFVIGYVREAHDVPMLLLIAVSLAVAAIPEGLPAITTITLALGMQRMARRGAIVRQLPAVETLGSATVICTDKTGTLTQNAMTVRVIETADASWRVTGEGYVANGRIERDDEPVDQLPDHVHRLVEVGLLCNDAHIEVDEEGPHVLGDPTEGALLILGAKARLDREQALEGGEVERRIPFDSDRKRMSVLVRHADGTRRLHVKGSSDAILSLCTRVRGPDGVVPLTDEQRQQLHDLGESHANRALRVLALAEREDPPASEGEDPEHDLTFLGFVAMLDPPRPEVGEAIQTCRQAGIRVVMITGDHRATAIAIAEDLDIYRPGDLALPGDELAAMSDDELADAADRVTVFARVTAAQKLRIVDALERRGHVVAMTGDGVNDAPALKEAAIGVAMGRQGTDVARQSAEMVLADDNFATIVEAVREGRAIYRNIQKFIFFLGSSNAGLVFAVVVAAFLHGVPELTPLQLLWINLVTNGLPALALGVDPPERSQMLEPPRPPTAGIVGMRDLWGVLLVGSIMGGAALALFALPSELPELFVSTDPGGRMHEARTMAFTALALSPLVHAHNCRSPIDSIFVTGLFTNRFLWLAIGLSAGVQMLAVAVPPLQPVFRTTMLTPEQWAWVLGAAALPLPIVEALKAADRMRRARMAASATRRTAA